MTQQVENNFDSVSIGDVASLIGFFTATLDPSSFSGSIQLERSYDKFKTLSVVAVYIGDGTNIAGADNIDRPSIQVRDIELENDASYRWNCTARSSGSVLGRLGICDPFYKDGYSC